MWSVKTDAHTYRWYGLRDGFGFQSGAPEKRVCQIRFIADHFPLKRPSFSVDPLSCLLVVQCRLNDVHG